MPQNAAILADRIDILQRRELQLRALIDAVAHEMHIVEAQRSQLEKDRIPFNWLPSELLIHIFVLATLDSLYPIQSPLDTTPVNISHVCQKWRDIALSTPTLWRRIVLTPSDLSPLASVRPSTQIFLDRSKGIPRDLYNRLLLNDPERAHRNPWHTDRFPALLTLTLRDIPLPGIALGQLPML